MTDAEGAAAPPGSQRRSEPLSGTLTFQLMTLGAVAADRFAAALAPLDLKPRHAALMAVVGRGLAASQLEVAAHLGVVPSLVVALADHLVRLGAVERIRDPRDRRRQVLLLTQHGHRLLERCAAAARSVDEELAARLPASERAAFTRSLGALANGAGFPT
ncbi:MarR family winged helix-turn-helix transcriptional regulator [Actinomadura fibrosa]|uniref:MarR family winged helix-turn-helix transcriptional regulator n=1 Tax=Actinomadura fibrosa TaxID=111802 RepID=A0ABW2XYS1_9ACTN|nr:MarR family winged helix-turn-helix transcriptional regulator [Actinomadura fibrosa]